MLKPLLAGNLVARKVRLIAATSVAGSLPDRHGSPSEIRTDRIPIRRPVYDVSVDVAGPFDLHGSPARGRRYIRPVDRAGATHLIGERVPNRRPLQLHKSVSGYGSQARWLGRRGPYEESLREIPEHARKKLHPARCVRLPQIMKQEI